MERKYSQNEVKDFIAKFKHKKGNKNKKTSDKSEIIEKKIQDNCNIPISNNNNIKKELNIKNKILFPTKNEKIIKNNNISNNKSEINKNSNVYIKEQLKNENNNKNKLINPNENKTIDVNDIFGINDNNNNNNDEIENIFQINKNTKNEILNNVKYKKNILNIKAINNINKDNKDNITNLMESKNINNNINTNTNDENNNNKNKEKKNLIINDKTYNNKNNCNAHYNNININENNNNNMNVLKAIKEDEQISLLRNIYDNFSNNLNINKESFFDSNIINDDLEILNLNYEESLERKNKIITNNKNSEEKSILDYKTDNINIKYVNTAYEDINNDFSIISNTNRKNINYCNISKDYLINYKKDRKINLENIYHLLYSDYEYYIYKNYFPVAYDNNPDLASYNNLLSLIINKNKEIIEPICYIVALLLYNIFSYNINLQDADIFKNEKVKKDIIEILFKHIQNKNNYDNINIINSGVLFNLLNDDINNNEDNNKNFMKYDLLNNFNNPIDFILQLYNNNIMNKNNNIIYYYFLLLNIKENNLNSPEHFEAIFTNFDICLYIILRYMNNKLEIKKICQILVNSLCPKMNYCQYIILKIILSDHVITCEKFYGELFTSFLNFVTIEKLMIADLYNLILYTINSEVKKIFAKSSILIKYKYSLLKKKYEEDQKDLVLKEKIYDNISQFGKISKNYYFMKYIKDEFCNINNNINKIDDNITQHNNEIINNNELDKGNNFDANKPNNNEEGFFTSIKFALGFGANNNYENNKYYNDNDNDNKEKNRQIIEDNNN